MARRTMRRSRARRRVRCASRPEDMAHHETRMPSAGVLVRYVLLVLLWGSTWAAIRIGVESVPPFQFAFLRAVAVSVVLTAVSFALGLRFPRDRRTLVAAAFAGIVNTGTSWAVIFWS